MKPLVVLAKKLLQPLEPLALLAARLTIAYGLYDPAIRKLSDIQATASQFDALGIPLPTLNAYLVAGFEAAGVVLLTLGLFTRLIALPLMVIMLTAVFFVHFPNGFSVANNGFEIPLYYFLFLFIFATAGAGSFSLDRLLFKA